MQWLRYYHIILDRTFRNDCTLINTVWSKWSHLYNARFGLTITHWKDQQYLNYLLPNFDGQNWKFNRETFGISPKFGMDGSSRIQFDLFIKLCQKISQGTRQLYRRYLRIYYAITLMTLERKLATLSTTSCAVGSPAFTRHFNKSKNKNLKRNAEDTPGTISL